MVIMLFDRFSNKNKLTSDIRNNKILAAKSLAGSAVDELDKKKINEAKESLATALKYLDDLDE